MVKGKRKYLQITVYVLLVIIFIFVMGITRNCSKINSVPPLGFSQGDTIDIALLYMPGGYYTYEDTIAGINLDLAEGFSEDLNIPIKIWAISDATEGMEKLESGAFDILASLPLDYNVKKRFPVSESIFLDRLVLVQLADSLTNNTEIKSSLDLDGKTIHVASGSSAAQRLSNLAEEIGGNINIIETPQLSDELLTLKVANGSVPYAVVNEKVVQKISQSYPQLNYDSSLSFTQFQVWLFNKEDSVIYNSFNNWLDQFRTTEQYREIINKY